MREVGNRREKRLRHARVATHGEKRLRHARAASGIAGVFVCPTLAPPVATRVILDRVPRSGIA